MLKCSKICKRSSCKNLLGLCLIKELPKCQFDACITVVGRHGGLMGSALYCMWMKQPSLEPWLGHFVVFLERIAFLTAECLNGLSVNFMPGDNPTIG